MQPGCLPRKQWGGQTGALKYSVEGERLMEIGTKTEVPGLYPGSGPKPITVADVVFSLSSEGVSLLNLKKYLPYVLSEISTRSFFLIYALPYQFQPGRQY